MDKFPEKFPYISLGIPLEYSQLPYALNFNLWTYPKGIWFLIPLPWKLLSFLERPYKQSTLLTFSSSLYSLGLLYKINFSLIFTWIMAVRDTYLTQIKPSHVVLTNGHLFSLLPRLFPIFSTILNSQIDTSQHSNPLIPFKSKFNFSPNLHGSMPFILGKSASLFLCKRFYFPACSLALKTSA